jgi:hypothetical protein
LSTKQQVKVKSSLVKFIVHNFRIREEYCTFSQGFCDFEDEAACNYVPINTNTELRWELRQAKEGLGPEADHSSNSYIGHYLLAATPPEMAAQSIVTRSAILDPTSEETCLKFWYYVAMATKDTRLQVYITDRQWNETSPIWQIGNIYTKSWVLGKVTVPPLVKPSFIYFEAKFQPDASGLAAIDDLTLNLGRCGSEWRCSFDDGDWCSWFNEPKEDHIDWVMVKDGGSPFFDSPRVDHSTSGRGAYLVVSAEAAMKADPYGSAMLKHSGFPGKFQCLSFYEFFTSFTNALIEIYTVDKDAQKVELYSKDYQDTSVTSMVWERFVVKLELDPDQSYMLVIKLSAFPAGGYRQTKTVYSGTWAIDSIEFLETCQEPEISTTTEGPSPTTTPQPFPNHSCNFEQGEDRPFCNYQTAEGTELLWVNHQAGEELGNTLSEFAPFGDHSSGSSQGHYIYLPEPSKDAALLSPTIDLAEDSHGVCFNAWAHLYGNAGQVGVHLMQTGVEEILYTARFNNPFWKKISVHARSSESFRLKISGLAMDSASFVALDDFSLSKGACLADAHHSCDFESGLCGFQRDPQNSFAFQITQPHSQSWPSADHTTGTSYGYYLHAFASDWEEYFLAGDTARMVSPVIGDNVKCVQFWYTIYGKQAGRLKVYFTDSKELDTSGSFAPDFETGGMPFPEWHVAQVMIPATDLRLVFEAQAKMDDYVEVFIDDVEFLDSCEPVGWCNYEKGTLCTWFSYTQVNKAHQWIVGRAKSASVEWGPYQDHTLGTEFGMFATVSMMAFPGESHLTSNFIELGERCVEFYFYSPNLDSGSLGLFLETYDGSGTEVHLWSQEKTDLK